MVIKQQHENKKSGNKLLKILAIVAGVLFLLAVAGYFGLKGWFNSAVNEKNSDSSDSVIVTIEQGENVKSIANKLEAADAIKSADIFYWYVKLNKLGGKIQAGDFQLQKNLTVVQVADSIQKAAGAAVWITIPEGLRYDEMADVIDKKVGILADSKFRKSEYLAICEDPESYNFDYDFLETKPEDKSLEGFLFPDTYSVEKDITTEEFVKMQLETFDQKIYQKYSNDIDESYLNTYGTITLASIVEREARSSDDRKMVADILFRRLKDGVEGVKLLQTDATLLYEHKDWNYVITQEDKDRATPYNTYANTGLPPTPITNPGLESVEAVLFPEENEYWYYLNDEDGVMHYSYTHNEHNRNVRCYIYGDESAC